MRIKLKKYLTGIFIISAIMLFLTDFLHTLHTLDYADQPRIDKFNDLHRDEIADGWSYSDSPHVKYAPTKASLFSILVNRIFGNSFSKNQNVPAIPEKHHVWPIGFKEKDDRILTQLEFKPDIVKAGNVTELKYIYVITGITDSKRGQQRFIEDDCPVNTCFLTDKGFYSKTADAILFQNSLRVPSHAKSPNQIWIFFSLESPLHTVSIRELNDKFNWTATYRTDSTIVTPYEKFVPYKNFTGLPSKPFRNYAHGKTEVAAWFVSNCKTKNNRYGYVEELSKYITVDIYGSCGQKSCPRNQAKSCFSLLSKRYKFYLSFENSNCKDYITEKFFVNALTNDIVPVVMGARKEEYLRVAPPHSFIHVDDFESPRELALYLYKLHHDDDLYNQYFQWKSMGRYINTKFYCRLCAMLHDDTHHAHRTWYQDFHQWWAAPEICVSTSTRNPYALWRKKHKQGKRTHGVMVSTGNVVTGSGLKIKIDDENRTMSTKQQRASLIHH